MHELISVSLGYYLYITRISRVAHNSKQVISNNEETPVTSLFRGSSEEFSYENVNLYKGNCVERIVGMYSLYSIQPCLTTRLGKRC